MVLINKKIFLLAFVLFCFWPLAKAQAKLAVLNTEFYKTASIDGLTITLTEDHPELKQWVVELLDQGSYQELGIYPSNQSISFSLKSAKNLEYSLDQGLSWQNLAKQDFKTQKVWLRPMATTAVMTSDSWLVLDIDAEKYSIQKSAVTMYPEDLQLISDVYELTSQVADYQVKFYYNIDNLYSKNIYQYNTQTQNWEKLSAYNNVEEKYLSFSFKNTFGPIILAIFQDNLAYDGIASFYNQARYRSFGYKNGNFVASRFYPKGSKLKITRLLTGKSIIVTVNDFGPEERTGRLVDLDISAFKQLGSTRAGVIYVNVEPYDQNK